MGKTAFLFSGQGSQYAGMGAELCAGHACAREVYEKASEAMGFDVAALSVGGSTEELSRTAVSQPLIYALSMAAFAVVREAGFAPDAVAGFSLGECSALTAAGAMTLETGLRVIRERAAAMQRASDASESAMYAVIGAETAAVEEACANAGGYVVPVNYNCPGQIVIAGEAFAAQAAAESLAGGRVRAVKLAVSAAFHSKLMQGASEELYEAVRGFDFGAPALPVYSNVTGDVAPIGDVPLYLKKQMVSPVRFTDEMAALERDGFDTFVELGPGKTLCGFIRKGVKGARCFNIEDNATLAKFLESASGGGNA